ncbi:MAG TPA: M48 family metallopeptidase [Myxococcota bacterium]|nr:M48 family metallopeptidase [Myxococcota bacterium]
MSARTRALAIGGAAALIAVACAKVPYSERKQFNVIPAATMNGIGKQSYDEVLAESKVIKKSSDVEVLTKVGKRIAKIADQPDYAWSYALIDSEEANAWCLPGGYIGFYTGILPVLENEAGMAFVMGHEVGHAVAHHGAERMSEQLAVAGGLGLLDAFLSGSGKVTEQQRGLIMAAAGLAVQGGVILPFSRTHEKEADVIGMMYMADAGYPPGESMALWDRMSAMVGKGPPAFMSTHPSFDARKENQQEWLPEAKKRFARHKLDYDTRATVWTAP